MFHCDPRRSLGCRCETQTTTFAPAPSARCSEWPVGRGLAPALDPGPEPPWRRAAVSWGSPPLLWVGPAAWWEGEVDFSTTSACTFTLHWTWKAT